MPPWQQEPSLSQMVAIALLLCSGSDWITTTGVWLMRLAAILTLVSMFYYCVESYKVIRYRGGLNRGSGDRRGRSGYRNRRRSNHSQRPEERSDHFREQTPQVGEQYSDQSAVREHSSEQQYRHNNGIDNNNGRERRGVYGRRRRQTNDNDRVRPQEND